MPSASEPLTPAAASVSAWSALTASRARAGNDALTEILAASNDPGVISFSGGFPDPASFPWETLATVLADLTAERDFGVLQYSPVQGVESTRSYLRSRLEQLEGVRCEADELMVTSGGIDALECIGKALLDPGDEVLVESPTYLGALMSFHSFDAHTRSVPLDDEGLDPEALRALLARGARPKLLYTIPDHQNPAGVSLSAERREELVAHARRYGFLIVEDVAYRELSFSDTRLPSLWALAPDVTVQIGTFSKTFLPGVRLGWAAGPAPVVERLVWAKQHTDQGSGALGQRLLEEHGRRGLLDDGIARARLLYRRRWDLTRSSLEAQLGPGVTWTTPGGGFFTWLTAPGQDATELARRGREVGIAVVPGAPFFADEGGRENIRISFSQVPEERIGEGIARLAELIRRAR